MFLPNEGLLLRIYFDPQKKSRLLIDSKDKKLVAIWKQTLSRRLVYWELLLINRSEGKIEEEKPEFGVPLLLLYSFDNVLCNFCIVITIYITVYDKCFSTIIWINF